MQSTLLRIQWFACFTFIACGLFATALNAAEGETSQCRWAKTAPVIDGKLDDEAWKSAQVIDKFMLPWLQDKNRPAKTATKARLLWDREFLYFSAELEDHDLFADVTEHDGKTWDNDVFELFFKPSGDKEPYYEFQVNAAGTQFDMFIPTREPGKFDFAKFVKADPFHIDSKVALRGTLNQREDKDQGWTVEGKLPWSDFKMTGGRPEIGATWKFALCRYDFANEFKDGPELSTSAPLKSETHANFHLTKDYAPLKFVGPDDEKAARPYGLSQRIAVTTSTVIGSPEPPLPYRWRRLYSQLKAVYPIAVAPQPGSDRLLLITQDAPFSNTTLRRMKDDPNTTESEVLLADGRSVAYSIEFHPQFAKNGYVYIGGNGPTTSDDKSPKASRIVRYTLETKPPYAFDPKSALTIIEWLSDGHNGAAIAFGKDGMLYVTSGDGTSDSDTNLRGQEMKELTAKVLRIDVDHPTADKPYSVPTDNPFIGQAGIAPETWAYGMRNPWRMTCDKETGHLWVGNNGQDLWEQAYLIQRGGNYGWSVMEGSHPFYLNRKSGPTPFVLPTVEHHHSEARSLTGGIVYYGTQLPELRGAYIYGDHSTGKIWGVKHDGQKIRWHKELADTPFRISGFGTDTHGELLICDHQPGNDGAFYTLIPAPEERTQPSTFPRTLSESGLFARVQGHEMQPGVIPYSVNAPLWSDGADKLRFLVLPGADSKIEMTNKWGWTFPDLTVLVKTFSLEMEDGNPASKRYIETRFLTRQQGEWVGYSYLWNDDQTDATLVAKEGLDREYSIRGKAGERKQTWHYPSRTECMVCHSRAAAFVLGMTTLQMNKDHDYHGIVDNQLRAFDHIGLFKEFKWADQAQDKLRKDLKSQGLADAEVNQKVTETLANNPEFTTDKLDHLVNPYDPHAPLDARARSYLHSNCAVCHVDAGGGNSQFSAEYGVATQELKLFGVAPLHDKFNLADAKLIAPGHPEQSVVFHRVSTRGRGQMPQLATSIVDEPAVKMLKEWILQLKP